MAKLSCRGRQNVKKLKPVKYGKQQEPTADAVAVSAP